MNDSDEPYADSEKRDWFRSGQPRHLCTTWSEFFHFAKPYGANFKGDREDFGKKLACGNEDIVRNIPHCSVDGWTTLTRSKPDVATYHLPNTLEGSIPLQAPENLIHVTPSVLNAVIFFQRGQRDLEVLRTYRSGISFMKNFIYKISQALQFEKEFALSLSHESDGGSRPAHSEENVHSELPNAENRCFHPSLPKLGKVYAELRSCVKTCDEAKEKWSDSSPQTVMKCKRLYKECSEVQGKMLLHVRWLIEARLCNIGLLVAMQYEDEEFDFDEIFSTNENKRLCKLLELYNEYATKYLKDSGMSEKELHVIFGDLTQTSACVSDSPYIRGLGETHSTVRAEVIYPISVAMALNILSESFMEKIGFQVIRIFNTCRTSQELLLPKASNPPRKTAEIGFLWERASRIEMRPLRPSNHKTSFFRIIKRVAGISIPDINSDEAGEECTKLARWIKKHEKVVALFVSGLGGKTKILHKNRNLQDPYLSDDAISVSSSSSRASSSLARYGDVKSVSWKDSWNNEVIKSITSGYIEFLIKSIPKCFWKAESTRMSKSEMEKLSCKKDVDLILLQAVISNLSCLKVMPDKLHGVLLNTCTELLIKAALSCSDSLFCEMLGKATPMFDKPLIQRHPDGTGVSLVTLLCIASIQPLFHLMEFHSQFDGVAKDVLPAVEITLNAGFMWIKKKLQEFFSSWDLPALLHICLCDLKELTTIALDSLKLVEGCHNHIETRRSRDSATLTLATKYLHNIDSLITAMQMTSGSSITQLGAETRNHTSKIILGHFPPQKFWIQKNMIDCEQENAYTEKIIQEILKIACSAVSKMDLQCQLAGMTPIVNAVYEACLHHVAKLKIRFSMQGAMQLSYDFSTMINFITADISGLSHEARTSLSSLHSVKRALHVAQLLQSTSFDDSVDERFRPQSTPRSSPSSAPDADFTDEDQDDKFWLSLRKSNMKRSKTWASLIPCVDDN